MYKQILEEHYFLKSCLHRITVNLKTYFEKKKGKRMMAFFFLGEKNSKARLILFFFLLARVSFIRELNKADIL
jgi:hypothetical protein